MRFPDAGWTIRTEMVRCGYTMDSLSEETQISRAVLREILTGRARSISTRNLCAMARAFDYTASDFIDLLSKQIGKTE
jgi:transcriptional regulator with XRE-family HTH domain